MDLDVLYEDDHLLAVHKPAGIVVHPTYKHTSGTLLDAVRAYAADWPATHTPTIVGRLDRLTSGIVLVAKHATVHAALQRTAIEKDYLAVVVGKVEEARGEINIPLRVDANDRRRVIVATTGAGATTTMEVQASSSTQTEGRGRPSVTQFERLATGNGMTLLRCRLITGRRHQIRVHLAARGWPIVGDRVYGADRNGALTEAIRTFPRQALHAWRIAFTHPITGDPLAIKTAPPLDLRSLITATLVDASRLDELFAAFATARAPAAGSGS